MKNIKQSFKDDEKIIAIIFIVSLPFLAGSIIYIIHLKSINILPLSDADLILYMFSLGLIDLIICFGIYEILCNRRIKKPFTFHFARFSTRTLIITGYFIFIILLWHILNCLLFSLISWRHTLMISCIFAVFALVAIVNIPKIKNFLKKIEEGA